MTDRIEGITGMFSLARASHAMRSYREGRDGHKVRTLNRAGIITIQEISPKSGRIYEREPTSEELNEYKESRINILA